MTSLTDEQLNEMAFQYGLVAEGYWSEDAVAFAREVLFSAQASPIPEPPAALFFNAMEGHSGKRPIWSELGSTHDPKLFPIYELRLATPELGEDK